MINTSTQSARKQAWSLNSLEDCHYCAITVTYTDTSAVLLTHHTHTLSLRLRKVKKYYIQPGARDSAGDTPPHDCIKAAQWKRVPEWMRHVCIIDRTSFTCCLLSSAPAVNRRHIKTTSAPCCLYVLAQAVRGARHVSILWKQRL